MTIMAYDNYGIIVFIFALLLFSPIPFILFYFATHTAAALALVDQPGVGAEEIVRRAMKIAGDICVYTNHNVLLEIIDPAAIALAKKEKEDKELAAKNAAVGGAVEGSSSVVGVEATPGAATPKEDVVPTGY